MARIVTTKPPAPREPGWKKAGEEVVVIALDHNEVEAVWRACSEYRTRAASNPNTPATSLNGAGARVYEALKSRSS